MIEKFYSKIDYKNKSISLKSGKVWKNIPLPMFTFHKFETNTIY